MPGSNIDFVHGIDPTGFASITGAQLAQLIDSATPYTDKGLIIVTEDVNGVPQIPDASVTTKWQNYLWLRISPSTTSVALYAWNPDQVYPIYGSTSTNWNPVTIASIPAGSIQGYQIASATITYDKIETVQISQVTGFTPANYVQTTANPDIAGNIGGSFTTGLVINANQITAAMLQTDSVETLKIKAKAVTPAKIEGGTIGQLLKTTDGSTNVGWVTPPQIYSGLADPNVGGTDDGKLIAVNSGAGGTFKYVTVASTYGFTKSAVGGVAVPAAGATAQIAHTLGNVIPQIVRTVLVCGTNDTATAYVAGDEINIECVLNSSDSTPMFSVRVDAVGNVNVLRRNAGNLQLRKKGDGTATTVTSEANFTLKAYCTYMP